MKKKIFFIVLGEKNKIKRKIKKLIRTIENNKYILNGVIKAFGSLQIIEIACAVSHLTNTNNRP
jgi:hypothetical protein